MDYRKKQKQKVMWNSFNFENKDLLFTKLYK